MLSRSGIYAIRAAAALARVPRGKFIGAGELAKQIDAPRNYLSKILQELARHGVLESQKGVGGGFRLAQDPKQITLLDVVDPVERLTRLMGCILGRPECRDDSPCPLHARWKKIREEYLQLLRGTTLADLAEMEFF